MKITLGLEIEEMDYCVEFFNEVKNDMEYVTKICKRAFLFHKVEVEAIYVLKACEEISKNLIELQKEFEVESIYIDHFVEWLGVQDIKDTKRLFKNYTDVMIAEIDDAVFHLFCDIEDF